jgi:hypothetical protein
VISKSKELLFSQISQLFRSRCEKLSEIVECSHCYALQVERIDDGCCPAMKSREVNRIRIKLLCSTYQQSDVLNIPADFLRV